MLFTLQSDYKPTGDQPQAILQLVEGLERNESHQTLLGVTGSGKTFTVANVIAQVQRPTLVLSHNKTLAAQLYGEFKQFFPENAVEYFISYYDYYQPEAYIPTTNTYIEKDLMINQQIDQLRLSTTSSLMSGRRDVLVVASVSCIYGMGNPDDFRKKILPIVRGQRISRSSFLIQLVEMMYSRSDAEFSRGSFRVRGDTVDVHLPYANFGYRFIFFDEEIETIEKIDTSSGKILNREPSVSLFPANLFVTDRQTLKNSIYQIQDDLVQQIKYFEQEGRFQESERIRERTEMDLEMIRELGYCSGIENYSRYFDGRKSGDRPFCLLDFFPEDYLIIVDESHATLPQIRAMWGGDRSRKVSLVEYGFRLPSALDNRPLKFQEFEEQINQAIYVSATPSEYELRKSEGVVVEQIIRPTGLLDPEIEVKPSKNQIDDLLTEIYARKKKNERVLITTITKRTAEELSKYLTRFGVLCQYIHSEIKSMERVEILRALRLGEIEVLVGVNLLREGLDLPEVSLVAIIDADKEGFLRDIRSLIQTIGRAARNQNGKVIMYADKITKSMQYAIDETMRRRKIQMAYNQEHNMTPKTILKSKEAIMEQTSLADIMGKKSKKGEEKDKTERVLDPVLSTMTLEEIKKQIDLTRKRMEQAAKELDFLKAATLRDELEYLQEEILRLAGK